MELELAGSAIMRTNGQQRTGKWQRAVSRLAAVAFGIALALGVLEVGMRAAGYAIRLRQAQRNREAVRGGGEFRVLCLGESTTEGNAVHGRYPEMLQEILARQDLGVRVAVINQGRSGADTGTLLTALDEGLAAYDPHLAVVMMGVNDAGRTHAWGTVIAPGADRWYGDFRLYKLYALVRSALEHGLEPQGEDEELVVGDGIHLPAARTDRRRRTQRPVAAWEYDPAITEPLGQARDQIDREEYERAQPTLERLLAAHPEVPAVHVELARLRSHRGQHGEALRILQEAVRTVPAPGPGLWAALSRTQAELGDLDAAIATRQFIIESIVDPTDAHDQTHYRIPLAELYERRGQPERAEATLAAIIDMAPGSDIAHQPLIDFYLRRGDADGVARHRAMQDRIRHEYVNPKVRANYLALRRRLAEVGVPLVAVQYPMRRVDMLRRVLDDDRGVVYVDNGFFRELVERDGYWRYFTDRFGGDFGHLTREGNELLARSVARAITEDFFGLPFRVRLGTTDEHG